MKFSLAGLALLASSVVAAPTLLAARAEATPAPIERSIRERRLPGHAVEGNIVERSQPVSPELVGHNVAPAPAATKTAISNNWGGAVIETPPAGTFTAASATFVLPKPTYVSSNPATTQSASIWVGIDNSAILQTGIDLYVTSSGTISYNAWYEWYPALSTNISPATISFSPGDTVILSVESTSPTTGNVIIENVSTGVTFNKAISGTRALTGTWVEWIVEDYNNNGNKVPLVNWNSLTFTNAFAHTSTGQGVCAWENGMVWNMVQNGTQMSSASGTQGTVNIQYVGPK